MTLVVVCLVFSLIFLVAFIKQLYIAVRLSFSKDKKVEEIYITKKPNKFQVVKKRSVLTWKRTSKKLCSQKIYAKFLFQKEFKFVSTERKILINKIYFQLSKNHIQFSSNVNFGRLLRSGINSPVYLVKKPKEERKFLNLTFALDVLKQRVNFLPIFVLEKPCEIPEFKTICLEDVNLKLLQEINKINLNYDPVFNETAKISTLDYFSKNEIEIKRIISKNNMLSYSLTSKENTNLCIFIKLKSFLFNIKKEKSAFEITYFNGEKIKYFCNNLISDFYVLNHNFIPYICVNLKIIKNCRTLLLCGEEPEKYKNLLLYEKMFLENNFNLKIYSKNDKFNNFFNVFLAKKIIDEIYEKNYLLKNKFSFDKQFISKFLCVSYSDIAKICSPLELRNFILETLGVEIQNGNFWISKKPLFNFKVVFGSCGSAKNIFVQRSEVKQVVIGETKFLGCSKINLNSLSKPATLCV